MKNFLLLLALSLTFYIPAFSQIIEKEAQMSLGVQTASELVLDDINPKDALKLWKEYFKEYGKLKRNKKAKEYYSSGVKINRIFTASKIDVYTKFQERGSNTTMTFWVDLGMGFVNSADYASEYRATVEMLDEFRVEAKRHVVGGELKNAENDLDDLKKKLTRLEKDNMKLHDKIAEYEQKILDAKDDINKNEMKQDEKRIEISKQIETLKEIQYRLESIK